MIKKDDILEQIAIHFANQASNEELLLIAENNYINKLSNKNLDDLLSLATHLKLIPTLNCGIDEHISDCMCTNRYPDKLE